MPWTVGKRTGFQDIRVARTLKHEVGKSFVFIG
jgi:hypothetical protein